MLTNIIHPLAHYNHWANEHLAHSLQTLTEEPFHTNIPSSFPSIVKTVAHIHGAEDVWRQRLHKIHPTTFYKLPDSPSGMAELNAWLDSSRLLTDLILSYGDDQLNEAISYHTLKGDVFKSSRWEMIQHVVNHSSYHRGQLITMMRQVGASSIPNSDMIAFYRMMSQPA